MSTTRNRAMPNDADHASELQLGGSTPAVNSAVNDYYERKAAGRCTRGGCRSAAAPDAQLCSRHLRSARRSSRNGQRRIRAERRDAGLCAAGCGRKSEAWYCAACAIRYNRIPRSAVKPAVNRDGGGVWRDDKNGWHRYRGKGKRGAPPAGSHDATRIKHLRDGIDRFEEAIIYARSAEVAEQGRIMKQATLSEAAALLGLVERYCEEWGDELRKGR